MRCGLPLPTSDIASEVSAHGWGHAEILHDLALVFARQELGRLDTVSWAVTDDEFHSNSNYYAEVFNSAPTLIDPTYPDLPAAIRREWAAVANVGDGKDATPSIDKTGNPRKRATKVKTELNLHAAMTYKADHPEAGETEIAKILGIPRTTLQGKQEWREWCLAVERAANSGTLGSLRPTLDKRTGELLAYRKEPNTNDLT